jgi:hypothetical protein
MLAIMVSEIIGKLIASGTVTFMENAHWFNIMIPVQFTFMFLLFYQNSSFRYWRRALMVIIATAILFCVYAIISGNKQFDTRNYTILAALVCVACLHFLYECMNSKLIAIHRNPLFYLALGSLLFYMVTLPLRAMYDFLPQLYERVFWTSYYLSFALNYIMYSLITFGIVWMKRK